MENIEKNIINPYGFIYITTNLINGKRYIGRCCMQTTRPNTWKNYLGSGVILKKAIKKYGKQNFVRTIISFAYNDNELNEQEYFLIKFFNATIDDNYYNISETYYYNFWKYASDKDKQSMKENLSKNSYWKTMSEEDIKKKKEIYRQKFLGERNPFFNKHHTQETKNQISIKNKGKTSGENNVSYWKGKFKEEHNRYGKTVSGESRLKMSKSAKDRVKRLGPPNCIPIQICFQNTIFKFDSIKSCYDFCKNKNIIPNTYKKKEPYPMMSLCSFKKKIAKKENFPLFQYFIDGEIQRGN